MGRQSFEAKSQSIEHHMRVSMKTFEFTTLTFLLILFEEDKSAYKMLFFFDNLAAFPTDPYIAEGYVLTSKRQLPALKSFTVTADDFELNDFQDLIKDWLLTFWHFPD